MAIKRTPPRRIVVQKKEINFDGLIRIVFSGEELLGFPDGSGGMHIKLFFPRPGQRDLHLPTLGENGPIWPSPEKRPITRTYSVRNYCPATNRLIVDFVDHGKGGIASSWARQAEPGNIIGLAGPGGPAPLLAPAENHFLIGDSSAIPAMSALIEAIPPQEFAHVVVLTHIGCRLSCSVPSNVRVSYLDEHSSSDYVFEYISGMINGVLDENRWKPSVSAWVAGENNLVVAVRDLLRVQLNLTKKNLYAIPYWRRGQNEEQYHQARHTIMDEVY